MRHLAARLACIATIPFLLHGTRAACAMPAAAVMPSDRIQVAVTGSGPDVILIPGLASSGHVWDATVAALAPGHRVHVVQIAGFAGVPAGANGSGPVLAPVVAALHDYIVANRLRAPAVIGHSLGGLIAMKLAIAHAPDVGRLMVVDSLPFVGMTRGPQVTVAQIEPLAAALRDRVSAGSQEAYAAAEPATMATLVKSTGPEARAATAAAVASDRRVVAQAMYDDMSTDLRPDLARITQPFTMLYPWDAATGIPQAAYDGLYRGAFASVPQAKVERIDGSFHFIMIDQPAAFQAAVAAFLKG